MQRYIVTLAREDGSIWRDVTLQGRSPDDAKARAERWSRIEMRVSTYRAVAVRSADQHVPSWVARNVRKDAPRVAVKELAR